MNFTKIFVSVLEMKAKGGSGVVVFTVGSFLNFLIKNVKSGFAIAFQIMTKVTPTMTRMRVRMMPDLAHS